MNSFNSLWPKNNGCHFAGDIFKRISLNEKFTLEVVPKVSNDNKLALVQVMAWRLPGEKPLFQSMLTKVLTASLGHTELTYVALASFAVCSVNYAHNFAAFFLRYIIHSGKSHAIHLPILLTQISFNPSMDK